MASLDMGTKQNTRELANELIRNNNSTLRI